VDRHSLSGTVAKKPSTGGSCIIAIQKFAFSWNFVFHLVDKATEIQLKSARKLNKYKYLALPTNIFRNFIFI